MGTESSIGLLSGILWFVQGLFYSLVNLFTALSNPQLWLDWSDKQALMRFIYYGGSTELFFVFLLFFLPVLQLLLLASLLSKFRNAITNEILDKIVISLAKHLLISVPVCV